VMELIEGGNLLDKIIDCNKFNEDHACFIVHQIMLAVNYMHLQNVMHRDLKLENIMCRSKDLTDFHVKLTDFGFSTFY
jgi:serine/threonine protein kinase